MNFKTHTFLYPTADSPEQRNSLKKIICFAFFKVYLQCPPFYRTFSVTLAFLVFRRNVQALI